MSKILFLADLHGNMTATLALEKGIEKIQPDDIWFLGDAVGKGPENDKTLDWVRNHCHHFIAGNWDEVVIKSSDVINNKHDLKEQIDDEFMGWLKSNAFYVNQLGDERIEWLRSLPMEDEVLISGVNFRLFHGRPIDENYHPYLSMDELNTGFTDTKSTVHQGFISADCHMPYIRSHNMGYAINTGSVGNSLGIPRCHALLIEGDLGEPKLTPMSMNILSIPYDNELAAKIADEYDVPDREAYKNEILKGVYSR